MGNLYLIKLESDSESFYKIGICGRLFSRFSEMKRYYNVTVIYFIMNLKGLDSHNIEQYTHDLFEEFRYLPNKKFGGYLECFSSVDRDIFMDVVLNAIDYDFKYYSDINLGCNGWLD